MSTHGISVLRDVPLSTCGTFRLGGPCKELWDCETPDEVIRAHHILTAQGAPFVLIGGGSNILFSDAGYGGAVLRFLSETLEVVRESPETIRVSCGVNLDALVAWCVEEGLAGMTMCSGIPGTVGGAVVGNAGAWGKQIGDRVQRLRVLDPDGTISWRGPESLGFAYRHSRLKEEGSIALEVELTMEAGDGAAMQQEREDILSLRREKHPDLEMSPCIGSFFRNLEPTSAAERRQAAGHYLEQVGAKEFREGGALVFPKHANIIVKGEGCRASDVAALHRRMRQAVDERFGIQLQREVRFLGSFPGEPPAFGFF